MTPSGGARRRPIALHDNSLHHRSYADRSNTNGWILTSVYTLRFCSSQNSAENRHSSIDANTEARNEAVLPQRRSTDDSDSGIVGLRLHLHCRDPCSVFGHAFDCPFDCLGMVQSIYSVSVHATGDVHSND